MPKKSFQGSQTAGRRPQAETNKRKDCVRARATTPSEYSSRRTLQKVFHREHHPPALFRPPSATKDTMGQRVSLQEELINMKITSKQMVSASKKCEKNEKKYRKDVKKAIEKGNAEGARIYAQNAIREKNSGLNYLRMSARIDAVAQRLDTVVKNQAMQKSIVKVNKGLSSALKSMNVEKISKEMDAFEKQFEDIDVRAKYMEDAMGNTTASATPEDQVDALISQVADEHQLDVSFALDDAGQVGHTAPAQQEDPLASRLEALRR